MNYWTIYWFQGIACFVFASTATFSGITGSALMLPWLIMGYALLGVPEITAQQAVAASIILETFAVTIGVYQYYSRGLIDVSLVKKLGLFVLAAAILGSLVSHWAPERVLLVLYSVLMLVVAWLLIKSLKALKDRQNAPSSSRGEYKEMKDDRSGKTYRFHAHALGPQRWFSSAGAFMEGLISAGTGEVTTPRLILRSGYPVPVAAATSLVLVVIADYSAAVTHILQFAIREEAGGVPWNVIVWGAPGMLLGAYVGTLFQGRVSDQASVKFFAALFIVIGVTFLAFTAFRSQ